MKLIKHLHLNRYEWWKKHRNSITYGSFLILFAIYINPIIKLVDHKNKCVSIAQERFLAEAPSKDKISREKSFVLAYQICNHRSN
ncbi:hypothetical protein [Prochlorococcus sp. MIT 1223]|uniref:hypothetical protein n=1 Tax=Prochlorococcus sp. MIT 1223 TaxID=3096217 RepID=UPI002A76108C|nr:hypothetical protein [Prochlorococcus sp. MIT 1223]